MTSIKNSCDFLVDTQLPRLTAILKKRKCSFFQDWSCSNGCGLSTHACSRHIRNDKQIKCEIAFAISFHPDSIRYKTFLFKRESFRSLCRTGQNYGAYVRSRFNDWRLSVSIIFSLTNKWNYCLIMELVIKPSSITAVNEYNKTIRNE